MEFEQIVKRLEWLDAEQRKNKAAISGMEERIKSADTTANAVAKQIKGLNKDISEVSSSAARLNQFNELLAKQRDDFTKLIDELEKKYQRRESEATKRYAEEIKALQDELAKLKKATDLTDIKRELKIRATEQLRLNDAISELPPKIDDVARVYDELKNTQQVLDENRRQDVKRVADLQGELTALRKRIDEARSKVEVNSDSVRNLENRVSELLASELDRKTAQTTFLEQQAMAQVDRDRVLKDWREKFDEFKQQAQTLDTQIANLDETLRAAKKAQETYTELNTKLERRISEISEMQRLAEDRLRQEWVTFKADDQKRWTGYSLSQDESLRDLRKDIERLEERTTSLDDSAQVLQDLLHQTTDTTEKQLQEIMNIAHEWMTAYERIMGHTKKAKAARTAK